MSDQQNNILQDPPEFITENGILYKREGDYYFPFPDLPSEELNTTPIGRFGRMHGQYLKKNESDLYLEMKLSGELYPYLRDIDEEASVMMEQLTEKMVEAEGLTEALKAQDQMEWVGQMNNIRYRAEEIVKQELIYI